MAIQLEDQQQRERVPVVKRTRIGQVFQGAVVRFEQRDVQKMNETTRALEPALKPNGKPRQEMVVYAITLPGTTAPAGIGDTTGVPEEGDLVRLILRGGAFGDWINARNAHRGGKIQVGDVVRQVVEHAQAYDANGAPKGTKITDQAAADAIPRGTTVGFYGPLTLHEPKADSPWTAKAEDAYRAATAITLDEQPAAISGLSDSDLFD